MSDESPLPAASKVTKSFQRQKGMGLYQDPTMDDERTAYGPPKVAEKTATTNTDNARRGGDFSAGFAMVDDSPVGSKAEPPNKRGQRTEFTSNWGFDGAVDSPPIKKIYKTAGDGMGSRKVQDGSGDAPATKKIYKTAGDGMGSRSGGRAWGIGDGNVHQCDHIKHAPNIRTESDPEVEADLRPSARSRHTQAQAGADLDF